MFWVGFFSYWLATVTVEDRGLGDFLVGDNSFFTKS